MPTTARLRGLASSFDPAEALIRSAEYLAFLREKFGNLGLAAAAYNGGEGAVSGWLAGTRGLAAETRDYVRIITGLGVEDWRRPPWLPPNMALSRTEPFATACRRLVENRRPVALRQLTVATSFAWGVQIAQHASADIALRSFERVKARFSSLLGGETPIVVPLRNPAFGARPRPTVFVGRASEDEARDLCRRLTQAGGVCTVRRN